MNFLDDAKSVLLQLDHYLNQTINKQNKVINQESIDEIQKKLCLQDHVEKGDLTGKNLDTFLSQYFENVTRLHHPCYLAHQVGTTHPSGALGSLIDGFTNNPMAIYEMGPSAAAVEFFMINLILSKIGWNKMPSRIKERLTFSHGSGVLTHGGSLANLTALLAAQNNLDKDIREKGNPGDLTILVPESSHYSIAKAAGIMGIGEQNVILLKTDKNGTVLPDRLKDAYQEAKDKNKRIVALVANACSTATGLYDPVDEIADFCNENGIWFHVDGAHGACALFTDKHKYRFKGVQKADSLIIDAHKMLRTPNLCAAILVKDANTLDLVFQQKASYLFHEKNQPGFDFIQQAIECTKAGLGIKFYFVLAAMGEKGMAAYIERQFDLTTEAHNYIHQQDDFECPCRPQSNILCFRYNGSDDLQLAIRDKLIEEGSFYISSTNLEDKRFLRIVLMSPYTTMEEIKELVFAIRELANSEGS
ncbi:MAG: aminotransferase class I/II-fold pyridoxal phosphate-dependent enzyme [Desulfobacteraceae bacterium]|nr:aminotransferase class I/II-fold pyridoxal phosphate-dependent enzyme [Desulfobacteraceae bacterium]